jgi:hypothetical protein
MYHIISILYRISRGLWYRFSQSLDIIIWFWKTRRLRQVKSNDTGKIILFCELNSFSAVHKVNALYAVALAKQNCKIIVLVNEKSWITQSIFTSTSKVHFVYLSDYLSQDIINRANIDAITVISELKDFDRLNEWEWNGFRTGRNVLSTIVRKFRVGRIDKNNSVHMKALYSEFAKSIAVSIAAQKLIEQIRPEHVIILEKGYTPGAEFCDACLLANVDVIQWCGAPQSDYLLFKRYSLGNRAVHPFSLGEDSWQKILSLSNMKDKEEQVLNKIAGHYQTGTWFNRQQLQIGKKIISEQEIHSRFGINPDRKIAVIFAHILYDATFFYGKSLYPDYERWLVETVRGAILNTNLDWLIKVHPVNVWRSTMDNLPMEQLEIKILQQEFGQLPPHIHIMDADTDINTYSLFSCISYGLTVRGTIGMELPCYGVPVLTAGTGRYTGRGFTIDSENNTEYQYFISILHEIPPLTPDQISLARRHAYASFFLRPFPMESYQLKYGKYQTVEFNSIRIISALTDGDLNKIADFILSSKNEDLLLSSD